MSELDWQTMLTQKAMTMYHLSQISGVPKTTLIDICSGKSAIGKCAGQTIQKLAAGLNCSMEEVMALKPSSSCDKKTGLPKDKSYLELGLPAYLRTSLENMKKSWAIEDSGLRDDHWDLYWCELNADINSAEVDQTISSEQAWYLREKYLRMKRGNAFDD